MKKLKKEGKKSKLKPRCFKCNKKIDGTLAYLEGKKVCQECYIRRGNKNKGFTRKEYLVWLKS